jgi:V8-like Glu-specific endopeptidase
MEFMMNSFLKKHFFILVFLISSCQPTIQSPNPPLACNTPSPIIIGNNDWIIFTSTGDDQQNANENTVAQIKIPAMMAACTAFLINEDTIMTNNHCIANPTYAVNVKAFFRNLDGTRTSYNCDQFIMTSTIYDFTLVKCANSPGLKYGWVGLADTKPSLLEKIYIVQENCDYIANPYCSVNKYVAFGDVLLSQNSRVYHNADTLPGSSGSPIFSQESTQVIGIHNAGSPATANSPEMNMGVPMYQIRKLIESTTTVKIFLLGTANNFGPVLIPPTNPPTPTLPPIEITPPKNCVP